MINKKKISIIIPTLDRLNDLKITIKSIEQQNLLPFELIIVDQSNDTKIKDWFKIKKLPFKKIYIVQKKKSLTVARNNGVSNSTGDLITFLDDDTTLDKDYLLKLKSTFDNNPNIIGVTGDIKTPFKKYFLKTFLNYIFDLLFCNAKIKPFSVKGVFGVQTYLVKPKNLYFKCEWLSGCNATYIKKIFEEFSFDEKLVKYSFKEDVDFSNRVYQKYPNKLIYNPQINLTHRISKVGRLENIKLIKMRWTYFIYIYLKNNNLNFIFYWSILGYLLKLLILGTYSFNYSNFKNNLRASTNVIKNLDHINILLNKF